MKTFSNLQCSKDRSTISWPTPRFVWADFWEEADKQRSVRIKGWDRSINHTNILNEASQYSLFFPPSPLLSPLVCLTLSRSSPIPQSIVWLDEIFNPRHCSPSPGFLVNFTRHAGALGAGVFKSLLLIVLDAQTARLLSEMKCPTPFGQPLPSPPLR